MWIGRRRRKNVMETEMGTIRNERGAEEEKEENIEDK